MHSHAAHLQLIAVRESTAHDHYLAGKKETRCSMQGTYAGITMRATAATTANNRQPSATTIVST